MKRFIKLGLSLVLCLSIFACSDKEAKNNEDFSAYLDTLPAILVGNEATFINQLFDDPKAYGIEVELYKLDYASVDDYQKSMKDLKAIKKKLKTFDRDDLSKEQQISYDVLMNYIDREVEHDFFYLSKNYFDVNSGVQSSLPLELWTFEFKNKISLDSFVSIMESTPEVFTKYVDFEKERQSKGYGMSQTYLDDVIEGFKTFNENDHSYIIDSANEKIDNLDFINDEEKEAYKTRIAQAYTNDFLPAYKNVQASLETIQSTASVDAALCDYEMGKEYYEYLLATKTGYDDVDDFEEFLDKQESIIYKNAMNYLDQAETDLNSVQFTDIDNTTELLQYFESKVNADKEFPKLFKIKYQMEVVPEALRTIFQSAAAYYLSAYDSLEANNQMILNGEYSQSDFDTIAHEGFPGHMYQHNYFKTVDHHVVRDIFTNVGYLEGWATYAATQACDYADDTSACEYVALNNDLSYLYLLRLDKMIHYDGLSREEVYAFLKENFAFSDENEMSVLYEQLLENPTIFAPYYGGKYQLMNLQSEAKDAWGDDYSDKRFNETILEYGPLPFELLNEYMEEEFK